MLVSCCRCQIGFLLSSRCVEPDSIIEHNFSRFSPNAPSKSLLESSAKGVSEDLSSVQVLVFRMTSCLKWPCWPPLVADPVLQWVVIGSSQLCCGAIR